MVDPLTAPAAPSIARRALRVARGAMPAVMTATLIPLGLFYAVSAAAGMRAGIVASLVWAYLVLARQLYTSRRRVSGLLVITAFTLTVRCLTWALHQTTFTYFSVPVAETIGMGLPLRRHLGVGSPPARQPGPGLRPRARRPPRSCHPSTVGPSPVVGVGDGLPRVGRHVRHVAHHPEHPLVLVVPSSLQLDLGRSRPGCLVRLRATVRPRAPGLGHRRDLRPDCGAPAAG